MIDQEKLEQRLRAPALSLVELPKRPHLDVDLISPLHNDYGNAERIMRARGKDLRYCHAFKKWLVWDSKRWAVDTTDQVRRIAKEVMLAFLEQAIQRGSSDGEKFAKQSLEAKRISSALSMAECEIFITPDDLDQCPYLLNCKNGVVDLRSGELLPHEREHFITRLVHHDYVPGATCPTFLSFLNRVMGGGPDASESDLERADHLIGYLQKAVGYSLTGTTIEKVVFLAFGSGNNGKTTMLATIRQLIEEYSVLLQIDSLMTRQESNNTQADLADLRGARFVMTSETEEGQRLAEGKLKRITQGMGRIKATRKYENPVEFTESHKLWMDANHKPIVRGTDNAIWNRLHPIPFTITIPVSEIDRDLPLKLLAEAEGILAWGVTGAVRWFKEGLGKPPEIEAAVKEYRGDMDQIGRFIDESCVLLPTAGVKARPLYSNYKRWAEEGSETVISETAFARRMGERGFSKSYDNAGTRYEGIGLKALTN